MRGHLVSLLLAAAVATACGGSASAPPRSAGDAVSQYVSAVASDDPRAAYSLLAAEVRRDLSYDQFEAMWQRSDRERKMQAAALEEARKARPELGARAVVAYQDGRQIALAREASRWRLERALVGRVVASSPRDAVRAVARAIDDADFAAFVAVLSRRKREPLLEMLTALSRGLGNGSEHFIQRLGDSRAQLFFEDDAGRYRLDLILEDDGWRLDDFEVILKEEDDGGEDPGDGEDDEESASSGVSCSPTDPLCGLP